MSGSIMSDGREQNKEAGETPASGLSNRPYPAEVISTCQELQGKQTRVLIDRIREKKRKLTPEEKFYIDNELKFRYRKIVGSFERRNGFPYSWQKFILEKIRYEKPGDRSYHLKIHPLMISVGCRESLSTQKRSYCDSAKKKEIKDYSWKSRSNLHCRLLMVNWDEIKSECIRIGTLTYPKHYPKDGITIKRHLRNILKRMIRFGEKYGGIAVVWKLEFQERGAPHFHLLIVSQIPVALYTFRNWISTQWASVVNEWTVLESDLSREDKSEQYRKNIKAGTSLEEVKSKRGSLTYFSYYIGKGRKNKEAQLKVPEGFEKIGRWWGIIGEANKLIPPVTESRPLEEEQFTRLVKIFDRKLLEVGVIVNSNAPGRKIFFKTIEDTRSFISALLDDPVPGISAEEPFSMN